MCLAQPLVRLKFKIVNIASVCLGLAHLSLEVFFFSVLSVPSLIHFFCQRKIK